MQCSADQFPFGFWDELSVWGLATLTFSFFGLFLSFFFFLSPVGLFKTYSNHPAFPSGICWMRERQLAGQDTHKVYEGWKVKERSPLPPQKKETKKQEQHLLTKADTFGGNTTHRPPSLSSF